MIITRDIDKPVEALQSVMQRRAGYIATILQLNAFVEDKRRQLSGSRYYNDYMVWDIFGNLQTLLKF